jgi:ABC-type transport system involved in multi-copper enzyme maturation permease subunit
MLREDVDTKGADPFLQADFGFGNIDFIFIIKVIISLLVIFFAYDLVSGEKEHGTLRLSLSNSLPRWKLMFGKTLSGLGVIMIFLTVSILTAALMVALNQNVRFSEGDWLRVLLIYGISLIYLAVFFTLSAMISIIADSAAVSLIILVQLWVMITLVIPGAGALAAQTVNPLKIQSIEETDKQIQIVSEEYRKKENLLGAIETNEKAYQRDMLRNEGSDAVITRAYVPRSNALSLEAERTQNALLLSPAGLYERIALRFARTDFEEYDTFQKNVFVYFKTSSIDRLNRIFSIIRQPGKDQTPVEHSFTYKSESTWESFRRMGWNIFILFAWGLVFFTAAHAAFLRKDVR